MLRLLAAFTSLTHPQPPPQAGALVAFSRLRMRYNLRLCNLVYNFLVIILANGTTNIYNYYYYAKQSTKNLQKKSKLSTFSL